MKRKQAHILYKKYFEKSQIREIYESKVSLKSAVGMDGIKHYAFKKIIDEEIKLIQSKTQNCSYKFTIYKLKLILKGAQKLPRPLSIPTIRDRLTLRILNTIVSAQRFFAGR